MRHDVFLGSIPPLRDRPVASGAPAERMLRKAQSTVRFVMIRIGYGGSRQTAANYGPAAYAPQKERRCPRWSTIAFALLLWSRIPTFAQNETPKEFASADHSGAIDVVLPTDN